MERLASAPPFRGGVDQEVLASKGPLGALIHKLERSGFDSALALLNQGQSKFKSIAESMDLGAQLAEPSWKIGVETAKPRL